MLEEGHQYIQHLKLKVSSVCLEHDWRRLQLENVNQVTIAGDNTDPVAITRYHVKVFNSFQNMTSLDLSNNQLYVSCWVLGQHLNRNLRHLNLAHNYLSCQEWFVMLAQKLDQLENLNLSGSVRDAGFGKYLVRAFDQGCFRGLKYLNLNGIMIGDHYVGLISRLRELGLVELHLCCTRLKSDHLDEPFGIMDQLKVLDVSHNMIGTVGFQKICGQFRRLDRLSIKSGYIAEHGIKLLMRHFRHLCELDLYRNLIHTDGLEILADAIHLTKLRKLGLAKNKIDYNGGKYLPKLVGQLEELDLSCNELEDLGMQNWYRCVRETSPLKKLSLFNCDIGETGVQYLELIKRESLVELVELDVSCNDFNLLVG